MAAKVGRPTDNPKEERITVRLDAECSNILNDYCKKIMYLKLMPFVLVSES